MMRTFVTGLDAALWEPISASALIAGAMAAGTGAYSITQQAKSSKRAENMALEAQAAQKKTLDEQDARVKTVEEGQARVRTGGRGLLAFVDDRENLKTTLGGS
jgi:uncharacterized protein HemX